MSFLSLAFTPILSFLFLDFVYIWAWIFIVTTTLVLIFKRENGTKKTANNNNRAVTEDSDDIMETLGVCGTYKLLWDIIKLKPRNRCCI